MNDYQKLSADLSRITEFLISGNKNMADKFCKRTIDLYSNLPGNIGKYKLSEYLKKIHETRNAEMAMTASVILSRSS